MAVLLDLELMSQQEKYMDTSYMCPNMSLGYHFKWARQPALLVHWFSCLLQAVVL